MVSAVRHHRGPDRRPGQSITAAGLAATGGTPLTQFGLGQLMSIADVGRVPLRHFGSEHALSATCTGGVPLMHFGSGQLAVAAVGGGPPTQSGVPVHALAAIVDRPNEPAITATKTTVSPNSLRICIATMIQPSDMRSPHVTSCFHGYRDIQR